MNKFLTFQGQQPLYLGDVDFASQAIRDAFKLVLRGLTGSDSANAILRGVAPSTRSSSVSFSAGVVSIDGEILPVDASLPISGTLSDTFYLRIKSTYGGSRTFKDGETHSCWETRSVEVTKDVTDYPLSAFRRLVGGFGTQKWHYEDDAVDFNLVRTGVVWLVTIKRTAMTSLEEHFFEVNVPGIQSNDLLSFPTVDTLVPATVFVDGPGTPRASYGITSEPLAVKYSRTNDGELHILMDMVESSVAAGTSYAQVVLPVFNSVENG